MRALATLALEVDFERHQRLSLPLTDSASIGHPNLVRVAVLFRAGRPAAMNDSSLPRNSWLNSLWATARSGRFSSLGR